MSKEGKNKPRILAYVPFYPHQNKFISFNYFCKVTVITDISYVETLFPTCLIFAPRLFE